MQWGALNATKSNPWPESPWICTKLVAQCGLTGYVTAANFTTRGKRRFEPSTFRPHNPEVAAVHANEAACEIQFGHLHRPTHRNTTWDLARDEVAAHKWVDISQGDYGVALLNDCKYGHKIKDSVLDLNLLRSVPYPGSRLLHPTDVVRSEVNHAFTDQCDHTFTYTIYPHIGGLVEGGVIQAGYELNVPLRNVPLDVHPGDAPTERMFISMNAPNLIIEAVKKAEDDDGIVIRLYEAAQRSVTATVQFDFQVATAEVVNLMETHVAPLAVEDNTVTLEFRPFEIKTIKIQRA